MKKRIVSLLLALVMVLGMIPAVAGAETASPEIKSVQMVLGSILNIKLSVDLNGEPAENYTMEVTVGNSATQTLSGKAEGDLYVYTADLMAHQMTDSVSIVLKNGETEVASKIWTVAEYVAAIQDDADASEEAKALAQAMYNYGQYAAYYKNGGNDPAIDAVINADAVAEEHKLELRTNEAALKAVAYLYLDEACDLGFKFNKEAMTGLSLYVDGTLVDAAELNETQVQYKIANILPQDYAKKHTVQVKNGETLVFDLSYSVLSYIYQWQERNDSSYAGLLNLLKAMQVYGTAAEAYCDTLPVYLTAENAGTPELFSKTINAAPAKEYILAEDLDWTDLSTANYAISTFDGTLDGQGHSIKGFTMAVGGDGAGTYYTCLFAVNNGTIRNIAFDYNVAAASGNTMGLVAVNQGTVENLFVTASYAAYSNSTTGAIVATNYGVGTVQNSIAIVSSTLTDQAAKNKLGSIVGTDYNGKILNCYAVNTENSITTPYVDTWGNGSYTGSAVYADNDALLADVTVLSAADGWSDCWDITSDGITFNGKVVIAGTVCDHVDASPVDGICDLCSKEVEAPEGTYFINSETAPTAKDFAALINADLAGTYYVTEDLTYSGNVGIGDFTGVLDGQGHSIKGFGVGMNSKATTAWTANAISSNSGTIQNIALEYTITTVNNDENALIGTNKGIIQNVYAKVAMNAVKEQYGTNSAFVSINDGTSTAVIQNCIVDVTVDESIEAFPDTYGAIVSRNASGATVDTCYYNVTGATMPAIAYLWGTLNNAAALATLTDVPASDGWSDCWSVKEDGIYFGDIQVLAIAPACQHTDGDPSYDGICDLCGEAYIPEGTYLINSTTAPTAKDFVALINADLAGTYYVTEDLTYSGNVGIGDFTGVLDGQGHSIKGFGVGMNSKATTAWTANAISSNSGTIQNIALEYTITTVNNDENALIGTNKGIIQNVYAKVAMNAVKEQYGTNSAFVSINDGTSTAVIQNCIVDVTVDESIEAFPDTYGAIVSRNASGATVDTCYYNVTGATMPAIAYLWGTLNNAAALATLTDVSASDGWSDCWSVETDGIYFGSILVLAIEPACEHVDASHVDGICDNCGEAVALPENTYLINSTTAPDKKTLVALINDDLDGTYYVTEDIAYTAESNTGIGDFTGVLDGQGHTISGIQFKYGNIGSDYNTFLFKSNSGTIKNIGLEYTILSANSSYFGLIATNTGTIQNVYAKATMKAMKTDGYGSAFVGEQGKDSAGIIENCIVDVTIDSSITNIGTKFGAIVGCSQSGTTVQNCYYTYTAAGITVPAVSETTAAWGTVTNVNALDGSATVNSADGWNDCWSAAENGIYFGSLQIFVREVAEAAIAVLSDYKASGMTGETGSSPLAWQGDSEDDRANIFAWYDFEILYEEITGENIEVVYVDSIDELDSDKTYFVLGGTLATEAGYTYDGLTTDNGHKIVKDETTGNIYLYGKTGYGTANAMYAFLKQAFGVEFYSDTVYTKTATSYSFDSIENATFNPSVDYNWAYDGLLFRDNGEAINYAYQMRMGFVNYWHVQGGSFHAFNSETLNTLNSNFTTSGDVDLNAAGEINTSNAMVIAVADYIYSIASNSTRPLIAVGPADTHTWSTSTASQANLATYGANSGEYLLFMNAVIELLNTGDKYADIRDVEVAMLVYNGSLAAPTSNLDALKPNTSTGRGVTLKAMFAPVEMNINAAPTDTTTDYYDHNPTYYYGEYAKWQEIFGKDNVYFWRYSTIYNDYLVPVNTLEDIQANYQAIVGSDNYIAHLMDQGTGKSAVQTNFQALAVYLKGQLGKNVNADLDTLITNFCNAYYGEAAGAYIKSLLTAEQSHLNTLSSKMSSGNTLYNKDVSGCTSVPNPNWYSTVHDLYGAKWWSTNCSDDDGAMLKNWYGYITSALAATSDTEQQARINVEAIAIRYISLKAHGVALISGDTLEQVEADAIALGITYITQSTLTENLA